MQITVNAVGCVQGACGTCGEAEHCAFALEVSGIVLASGGIGETAAQDTINPALEHGWHGKPPHRKLENHQLGPCDLVLLGLNLATYRRSNLSVRLLLGGVKKVPIDPLGEILCLQYGVPAHGIKVTYPHFMV